MDANAGLSVVTTAPLNGSSSGNGNGNGAERETSAPATPLSATGTTATACEIKPSKTAKSTGGGSNISSERPSLSLGETSDDNDSLNQLAVNSSLLYIRGPPKDIDMLLRIGAGRGGGGGGGGGGDVDALSLEGFHLSGNDTTSALLLTNHPESIDVDRLIRLAEEHLHVPVTAGKLVMNEDEANRLVRSRTQPTRRRATATTAAAPGLPVPVDIDHILHLGSESPKPLRQHHRHLGRTSFESLELAAAGAEQPTDHPATALHFRSIVIGPHESRDFDDVVQVGMPIEQDPVFTDVQDLIAIGEFGTMAAQSVVQQQQQPRTAPLTSARSTSKLSIVVPPTDANKLSGSRTSLAGGLLDTKLDMDELISIGERNENAGANAASLQRNPSVRHPRRHTVTSGDRPNSVALLEGATSQPSVRDTISTILRRPTTTPKLSTVPKTEATDIDNFMEIGSSSSLAVSAPDIADPPTGVPRPRISKSVSVNNIRVHTSAADSTWSLAAPRTPSTPRSSSFLANVNLLGRKPSETGPISPISPSGRSSKRQSFVAQDIDSLLQLGRDLENVNAAAGASSSSSASQAAAAAAAAALAE